MYPSREDKEKLVLEACSNKARYTPRAGDAVPPRISKDAGTGQL